MDERTVRRYLDRIGVRRPGAPTADLLVELQARHLETVPFENLSIHLGEPVVLTEDALVDKIVDRRRGGFCYELNGLFAALLRALGFEVTLLSALVHTPNGLTHPFDHLALRVDLEQRYLVDVGFGAHARRPLRLDWPDPQLDPEGEFLVVDAGEGEVDVLQDGTPRYRVEPRARRLADFGPTCWWQQTSPDSHFTHGPTCSLPTANGRITLAGTRLIRTVGGTRTETRLTDEDQVLAAYREHFGIVLDRTPDYLLATRRYFATDNGTNTARISTEDSTA
ncbi:arylamine N-acetyltransferase family protein [Actinophytocola xanthii]|uniref:Acetyltransferase n=1 Tax=Actinophytocola xanthii TaxID=1912961 RepID=A0A1Q8C7X1_9PSEU|nr:arylamine N-acetyltransferase [Actinophytocola xanthii]OLF10413.1 acetyltransferase [Actinophytocola xanthii]